VSLVEINAGASHPPLMLLRYFTANIRVHQYIAIYIQPGHTGCEPPAEITLCPTSTSGYSPHGKEEGELAGLGLKHQSPVMGVWLQQHSPAASHRLLLDVGPH
jgi:hypothetical protein